MMVMKKISLLVMVGLCLPVFELQAKKKDTEKVNVDQAKPEGHFRLAGLLNILFPIPAILYHAGNNAESNGSSENWSPGNEYIGKFYEIFYPGDIKTRFTDVAGLDGAKEDMQDVMNYMKDPARFKRMGAKVPKGILMVGGPGNGKTFLARAAAGEMGCPFISVKGADFSSMWAGVGKERVTELFKVARKNAPCIIFIDEIDAVASARSNHPGGVARDDNKTIIALLTEMDGLQEFDKPVIIFGATNRIDQLDPAIIRPGRFDRVIEIPKPFVKDRAQLLHNALAKIPLSDDINIDRIARATSGFSGAELANLVNEALILAVKDDLDFLCMNHIEIAYDNITLGRENKGMVQTADDLWNTAVHEAGHLIGYLFQAKNAVVHKVSIVPRGNVLGVARMLPLVETYSWSKTDMKNQIVVCLAGRFAEDIFGIDLNDGAANDLERAESIAYDMVVKYGMGDDLRDIAYFQFDEQLPDDVGAKVHSEVKKIIEQCRIITRSLIADHKKDIEKIAKLLVQKRTVQGDEIYRLLGLPEPEGFSFNF